MVARFAGARSLDDRRRRRIVTGTDTDIDPPITGNRVANRPNEHGDESPGRSSVPTDHLPLRKLISPRLWKHAVIGTAGLAVGASLLMAAMADWSTMSSYGPDVPRMLSVTAARAVTGFAGILLFLAGELSLLCWWARSRSAGDFSGSYRIWMPTAAALMLWSGCSATGIHRLLGMIAAPLLSVGPDHAATMCWLLPAIVCGIVICRPLSADMRGCRLSLSMLWLAATGSLTAGWLLLGFPFPLAGSARELAQSGSAILGNWFLFMSMLLHARHVIYVTAEPPAARPSRWRALRSRFRRSPAAASKQPGQAEHADLDNEQQVDKQRQMDEHPHPSTVAPKDHARANRPAATKQSAPAGTPVKTKAAQVSKDQPPSSGIRIDGPPTPEQLKGLSKRERRQLRKQWRNAQREAGKPVTL